MEGVPSLQNAEAHMTADELADKEMGRNVSVMPPAMTPEEGYEAVPGALADTDPVREENDILYVTNYFLERAGGRGMSEFLAWMNRQMAFAQRSGMLPVPHPLAAPVPEVATLAKYLRAVGHDQDYASA